MTVIVLQHMIDALSLGSLYALAALGIGLIFGVLQLINFAHGDFISFGVYALIVPSTAAVASMLLGGLPWYLLIVSVAATVVLLALASEFLVFRWLRTANPATLMISSFALGYIVQNALMILYTSRPKAINIWPNLMVNINLFGLHVPLLQIITLAVTIGLMVGLTLFLKKTAFGIQMRAAAEDFQMARLLGVRANRVISIAFAISGLMAAAISLLFVAQTGITSIQLGVPLMLFGFIATVIGGMGSLVGAVVGGFTVGIMSVVLQILLPVEIRPFRDAFVFTAVILILLFRPEGLLRVKTSIERV
ncbi:MAG: branched-chain amino acid ABC transporter permease [bacterium]|nr:branched-chain amino acid ABC transporter permease [bacterium]